MKVSRTKQTYVLSFEDKAQITISRRRYVPTGEIKSYNVVIDGQNFFDQPIRNDLMHMIIFEKLQQVNEMIAQLVVCCTIIISKTIVRS